MQKALRYTEFLLLFILMPLAVWLLEGVMVALLILWGFFAVMGLYLSRQPGFDWRVEWNAAAVHKAAILCMGRKLLLAFIAMVALAYYLEPQIALRLLKEKPWFLLVIAVVYPVMSVIPQEVVYRTYFFKRYDLLFPTLMIVASGLSFGLVHIIFNNWVAPVLSCVGGLIFAHTYKQHRSLALVTLEHSLYGILIFASGLGVYFYRGGAAILAQLQQSGL